MPFTLHFLMHPVRPVSSCGSSIQLEKCSLKVEELGLKTS